MPNKIQLKRSDVAARRPTTADLADGELFLNTNDETLSIKNKAGTYVKDILPKPSFNGSALDGHYLGSLGSAYASYPDPNTSVASYAPINHRHTDVVGVTERLMIFGSNGKTLYYGSLNPKRVMDGSNIITNISVAINSYWVNSGPVTLSIGTYNYSTRIFVDEEAYLKKISLKSDSPIAYGETISLRNPKTYAGQYISNGCFLGSSFISSNDYLPYVFIRCPSGGATSGFVQIFTEFASNFYSGSYNFS